MPLRNKRIDLEARIPRLACGDCGAVRQAAIGFAEPRRGYTRAFERYALDLSPQMTIKDAACRLGVSWDVVKDIPKRYLKRRFAKPKLKHLKHIAMDEISIGK